MLFVMSRTALIFVSATVKKNRNNALELKGFIIHKKTVKSKPFHHEGYKGNEAEMIEVNAWLHCSQSCAGFYTISVHFSYYYPSFSCFFRKISMQPFS